MFNTPPQLATTPGPALAGALARAAAALVPGAPALRGPPPGGALPRSTPQARAAAGVARLDQALTGHPLAVAFLHRARLDAVRRQAAVDGQLIDPWHLAAVVDLPSERHFDLYRFSAEAGIYLTARPALVHRRH